jgi:hypothetical protein
MFIALGVEAYTSAMLPEQENNYVRTTFKKGLSMCQEAKIIKILGGNNEC